MPQVELGFELRSGLPHGLVQGGWPFSLRPGNTHPSSWEYRPSLVFLLQCSCQVGPSAPQCLAPANGVHPSQLPSRCLLQEAPPPPSQAPLESNPLPSQPESQASPSHLSPARPGSSGCPRIILTPLPGALPCSWTCSITSFCPYTIIRHLQYASPLQETQTGERSQNSLSSLGKLH